jgi:signal transduction histidine kinase
MPVSDQVQKGDLRFAVDSRLLFELGERLVARKSVALAELVKNSYDADATKAVVRLENVVKEHGQIIVQDNGAGMTLQMIRKTWMRIATDDKDRNPVSLAYDRPRAGAKGIGRFASRRLAEELILRSVAKRDDGAKEETTVYFHWKEFEPGKDIDKIPNVYESRLVRKDVPSGVTLILSELQESWEKEDVEELQKDLLSLQCPFPLPRQSRSKRVDPGFSFKLEAPEFPELEGELIGKFFEASWGVLTGRIDAAGHARYKLTKRGGETVSFVSDRTFSGLRHAEFRINYIPYRGEFFKGLPFKMAEARKFGREQGGVRIYLDRFRVFPYGDPGDDWVDLDADRGRRTVATPSELDPIAEGVVRPMLQLPGNFQLFGAVFLSRLSTPDFELNISRERLLETDAFKSLKAFTRLGIDWMTVQYARYVQEREARTAELRGADPLARLKEVREEVERTETLDRETRVRILQILDLAKADWESQQKEQISELSMLRVLATVGTTVVIFDHELRAVVDNLRGIHTDLGQFASKLPSVERARYNGILAELEKWEKSVEEQGLQIGLLLSTDARLRRRRFALRQVVDEMVSPFARYMSELGVEFKNDVPPDLRTPPMFGCELQSVLLNLHTNALKAVKKERLREIAVSAKQQDKQLQITFCDTGVGIDPTMREEVFKPFVTTSEPDPVLGVGTGLGLKIVRDLLDVYGGTARFIDTGEPWKACIEITLPYRS